MSIDRDKILEEIRKAADLHSPISRSEFLKLSGISEWQVLKYFDSWNEAVKAAGIEPNKTNVRIPEDTLFLEMFNVFEAAGHVCNRFEFSKKSKYSDSVYKRRFGRWEKVLREFSKWLIRNNKTFKYLDQLPTPKIGVPEIQEILEPQMKKWKSLGKTQYGSILNFRGLQHAPVNEQGVVFLFGMVCNELEFVVESVRTGYPDCEAKRRVGADRWEKVRIEFEYKSSGFKQHGHDSSGCDLIVCWENDWPDAPLEVLELKVALKDI